MDRAFSYCLLRFVPYPDTEEFVNFGVLALCSKTGEFGYWVDPGAPARVAGFFPGIASKLFAAVVDHAVTQASWIAEQRPSPRAIVQAFDQFNQPREAVLRTSTRRACLAPSLDAAIDLALRARC